MVHRKSLVFDTSSIISLVTNNMLWILTALKKRFKGDFLVSPAVYKEMISVPLSSKKYKFEAMVVCEYMNSGVLKSSKNLNLKSQTSNLLSLANKIFKVREKDMKIFHEGEMETVVLALAVGADAIVTDERSMRLALEDPKRLSKLLSKKLHSKVKVNRKILSEFKSKTKGIKVLRSTELALMAYEMGLLDNFLKNHGKKDLVDAILWGLKTRGCAISPHEIDDYVRIES